MTSGSSQGLFVIVAIVIFGIFVVISYLLFRDKLQTGLASIFDDSIENTKSDLTPNPNLIKNSLFLSKADWMNSTANTGTSKLTAQNNELVWEITSSKSSATRNHLLYVVDSDLLMNVKTVSGSIDIFIEKYENTSNQIITSSNINLRYTNKSNVEVSVSSKSLDTDFETGRWYSVKLEDFNLTDIDASKGVRISVSLNGFVSGTIRVRKPKIEEGKKATFFIANENE